LHVDLLGDDYQVKNEEIDLFNQPEPATLSQEKVREVVKEGDEVEKALSDPKDEAEEHNKSLLE